MTKQTKQVEGLTTPTPSRPDPEVAEKAQRRRFSATYKERILAEAERCTEPGELGAQRERNPLLPKPADSLNLGKSCREIASI
jgi:hypothetical protein